MYLCISIIGGTCTLQLRVQIRRARLEMLLDCPSCQFSELVMEAVETCDIYSDLGLDNGKLIEAHFTESLLILFYRVHQYY